MPAEHQKRRCTALTQAGKPCHNWAMRGHPVFIAQHATATCCRGCLAKWHYIAKRKPLDHQQIDYVLDTIGRWLQRQEPAE